MSDIKTQIQESQKMYSKTIVPLEKAKLQKIKDKEKNPEIRSKGNYFIFKRNKELYVTSPKSYQQEKSGAKCLKC